MKRPSIDQNTAFALVGLVAMAAGLALIFLPAAFVVVGGLLLIYAFLPDQTPPTSPGGPAQ